MPDNARIEELRRRVEKDPASIAFAQLAEEYRRAGDHQEAVRVCRAGLEQHPAYLSARVTLGRALTELGQLDEAQAAFEHVLFSAPDNLVALRSLAELHQRRSEAPASEPGVTSEPGVKSELDVTSEPDATSEPDVTVATASPGLSFEAAVAEFNDAFGVAAANPVLDELDGWLARILADRADRERAAGRI